jgi:hypothetical protein
MNRLVTEFGYVSLNHVGEMLCGDNVSVSRVGEDSYVMVLADGMGSGVKANILSTLTSNMLAKMVSNDIEISQCVDTIIATLPISKDRGVAYCTFSIAFVTDSRNITVYNYDNPLPFVIRKGKAFLPEYIASEIHGKRIERSVFEAEVNDCLFMMSDGIIHAGVGEVLNYGWEEPEVMKFMEGIYYPDAAAKALATTLTDRCNALYAGKPGDDVTCAVVRIRERKHINVMIGPPTDPNDDERMASLFFTKKGKHIVCGGTTASIVARRLGRQISVVPNAEDTDIPPMSAIEGVDLVTEGMVTLNRVLEYGKDFAGHNSSYFDWCYRTDGASRLTSMLFEEATDIDFYVGCAMNPAHQSNRELNISFKLKLIDELISLLKSMDKNVRVSYF